MKGILTYVWAHVKRAARYPAAMQHVAASLGIGERNQAKPLGWRQPFSPPLSKPVSASAVDVLAPSEP